MANGYITPANGGRPVPDVDVPFFIIIDARLPIQPPMWSDGTNNTRYRIQMHRQLTLPAAAVTTERWYGWPGTDGENSETGALAAVWKEYDDSEWPLRPVGSSIGVASFSSTTDEPRHATYADGDSAYLKFSCDDAGAECLAIHFETENDEAFADSVPTSTRDYETIGRNTGTFVPYAANKSVSAWLLQRILAQNLNKIMYETKQAWTVPL